MFVLQPLTQPVIEGILRRALTDGERGLGKMEIAVSDEAIAAIARFANGDARAALNLLEFSATAAPMDPKTMVRQLDLPQLEHSIQRRALLYDKSGEEHYNLISLHKSMRNSDPDAAVYWVARMLEAGEDPLYIARRLIRFASEDVGNADPQALAVAVAAKDAAHFIGMPEGNNALAQARLLAAGTKSNAVYAASTRAADAHQQRPSRSSAPEKRAPADEAARLREGLPVRHEGRMRCGDDAFASLGRSTTVDDRGSRSRSKDGWTVGKAQKEKHSERAVGVRPPESVM